MRGQNIMKSIIIFCFLGLMNIGTIAQTGPTPKIIVDMNTPSLGIFHHRLLGVNNPMMDLIDRAEYDTTTKTFPTPFLDNMATLGLRSLRFPGGNGSGKYHWQNGLGPFKERPAGIDGNSGQPDDDYYLFGFMEFMDFLEDIGGQDPLICINFGTGTADEAAAWVEFANAEVGADPDGDGVDQAAIRARLGHPEPYQIKYWEIGNELGEPYKHMFSWHFGQLENLGEDYSKTCQNYLLGGSQWQYMDMDHRQAGQRVVKPDNWSIHISRSDGSANQEFFVKFPPLLAGSLRLWVWIDENTIEEWQAVADLFIQPPDAKVFSVFPETGRIIFGDGQTGAIPPNGAEIRVVYQAIMQDGLIDFSAKMKQVDPSIRIGVPFHDEVFYQVIQNQGLDELPFDFIVDHPYQNGRPDPLEKEHWRVQWAALNQGDIMLQHRANLDTYFGNDPQIGIVVSEYNLTYKPYDRGGLTNNPWYDGRQLDFFGRSLENGLFAAGTLIPYLRTFQQAGLEALAFHSLVNEDDDQTAGWQLSALMGPSPFDYFNPSGHVYSLFSQCYGWEIFSPTLLDVPTYRAGIEMDRETMISGWIESADTDSIDIPYLDAIGFRNSAGDSVTLFVLNRASGLPEAAEEHHDITPTLDFENGDFNHVTVYEFNGQQLWDINSHTRPETVSSQWIKDEVIEKTFTHSFPKHGLTMIIATQKNTSVASDGKTTQPHRFRLGQNHPNPFNPVTTIDFSIPQNGRVTLKIYDTRGREIRTLVDRWMDAGDHSVKFNATGLPSGIYIYRLQKEAFDTIRKMTFIR